MQPLSQPRTKDYAKKATHNTRGTLQSQNQNRFVDEIDEEYAGQVKGRTKVSGVNHYHSPVQLNEIGLSQ